MSEPAFWIGFENGIEHLFVVGETFSACGMTSRPEHQHIGHRRCKICEKSRAGQREKEAKP